MTEEQSFVIGEAQTEQYFPEAHHFERDWDKRFSYRERRLESTYFVDQVGQRQGKVREGYICFSLSSIPPVPF